MKSPAVNGVPSVSPKPVDAAALEHQQPMLHVREPPPCDSAAPGSYVIVFTQSRIRPPPPAAALRTCRPSSPIRATCSQHILFPPQDELRQCRASYSGIKGRNLLLDHDHPRFALKRNHRMSLCRRRHIRITSSLQGKCHAANRGGRLNKPSTHPPAHTETAGLALTVAPAIRSRFQAPPCTARSRTRRGAICTTGRSVPEAGKRNPHKRVRRLQQVIAARFTLRVWPRPFNSSIHSCFEFTAARSAPCVHETPSPSQSPRRTSSSSTRSSGS